MKGRKVNGKRIIYWKYVVVADHRRDGETICFFCKRGRQAKRHLKRVADEPEYWGINPRVMRFNYNYWRAVSRRR